MNLVLSFLSENWERLELERYGLTRPLSSLTITPRFRASSHVIFLVLSEGASNPSLVAKVPRLAGASASIEREVVNLRTVQASRPDGFDSIPQVVAFERYQGSPILVETALTGQLMDPRTVRRDFSRCCRAVTEWLTQLHLSTQLPSEADESWYARLVEEPLHYFETTFPMTGQERKLLEETRQRLAPLGRMRLPLVFEHGDLSHPNLFWLAADQVGVIDWEAADPRGLPACDLFFFLTYLAFARRRASATGESVQAFHEAFFGRSPWTHPYIETYARQLQIPLPVLTPLFLLCWLRYMVSLLTRLGGNNGSSTLDGSTAGWLRTNRYYALWCHTLTHINEFDWAGGQ